ncbi:MAG: hypothetical protein VXZ35_02035, partial [Pseudomonadota bacterium]|nr:hypothetical protein [Pseudomonadota bacterium]
MCTQLHVHRDRSDHALGFAACVVLPSRVVFAGGGAGSTAAALEATTTNTCVLTSVTTMTSTTIGDWRGAVPTTTLSMPAVIETISYKVGCASSGKSADIII